MIVGPQSETKDLVTADHHFRHANIIRYCNRPFDDVHHMDTVLVERWNEVVGDDDLVYYLGDFCTVGVEGAESYIRRLRGRISFMPGSHDRWMTEATSRFEGDVWSKHSFRPALLELKFDGKWLVLCHYAMRSWPRSFHGSYQLYGHSHGRLEATKLPRQMDIGVDCHDFYPVSLSQVLSTQSKDAGREPID